MFHFNSGILFIILKGLFMNSKNNMIYVFKKKSFFGFSMEMERKESNNEKLINNKQK